MQAYFALCTSLVFSSPLIGSEHVRLLGADQKLLSDLSPVGRILTTLFQTKNPKQFFLHFYVNKI